MGLSLSMHVSAQSGASSTFEFHSDAHKILKLGRAQNAQVCLEDSKVARVHAIIELTPIEAHLLDMGATSGSLVNGLKVNRIKLKSGDVLTVGDTRITLTLTAQSVAAQPVVATTQAPLTSYVEASPDAAGRAAGMPLAPFAPQSTNAVVAPSVSSAPSVSAVASASPASTAPSAYPASAAALAPSAAPATSERFVTSALPTAEATASFHPALPSDPDLTTDNRMLEVRMYWGDVLLGMNHYNRPKRVTIGEDVRADIFLSSEGLPTQQFPLMRYRDGEYVLSFSQKMQGEVEMAGQTRNLTQLVAQAGTPGAATQDADLDECFSLTLLNDARVVLHWSGATFALRFVPPSRVLAAPFGKDIDLQFINSSIFSIFTHMAIIVMLAVYPHNTDALKVDLFAAPDRFASLILETPKETKSTRDMLEKIKKQVEDKKEERQEVDDKKTDVLKQPVKMPSNMPHSRQTVEDKKQEVTKRFSQLFGGGTKSLLGGGGGGNLSGTLQNVIGTAGEATASAGLAGLGIRGSGPLTGGGIGTSRGLSGIGTSGRLGGGGANYGGGVGLGQGKAHRLIDLDTPTVEGALSADVIKRVINENKNQVRYCYEVELQHNQNLEGRVQMRWIIAADGTVAEVSVKESTLKNANVENCLMAKIRNWKFPPPAGGGTVEVNYPFVFKST